MGPRDFGGRKPKQLLQLPALHPHGLSKECLAEQIWGSHPPANVAGTVEHYVCVLRRRLRMLDASGPSAVVGEPSGYRLNRQIARLDIDRFDALVAKVSTTADSVSCEAALALAEGDLCEDEPYASWAATARSQYHDK